jgi:ribonuclease HII
MTLTDYDQIYRERGVKTLCGMDEAGRGPLAGPVYAAAVILPPGLAIEGLNDSKKLTEKKRERLYGQIVEHAIAFSVATATESEIDEVNILQANLLAMERAVAALDVLPDCVLVDGNIVPTLAIPAIPVVGGDRLSACIAAASILAKVERDRFMCLLDKEYPAYGFAQHKGYGTKLHYQMLDAHGPCPVHRRSFLKTWRQAR